MKKVIVVVVVAILMFSLSVIHAEYEDPYLHGVWLESDSATFIGIKDQFITNSNEFDFLASDDSYLRLTAGVDTEMEAIDGWVTFTWFIRDNVGVPFRKMWVSLASFGDNFPEIQLSAKNLEGFNNPQPYIGTKKGEGVEYGRFTWIEFEVPQNLKFAQPTSYELTMKISTDKPFDIGVDAIYLGDGTFTPDSKSPPLSLDPYQMAEKKLQIFNPTITTSFSDGLRFNTEDRVESISTRCPRGAKHPVVIGIFGGINLGNVELINDFPLKNAKSEKLCDIEISVVSYMRKRFKRDGEIRDTVTSAEYLLPGNSTIVKEGRTEFFWLDLDIPSSAKAGVYTCRLRIKTDEVENIMLPLSVEVLPYEVDVQKFSNSLNVSKLRTVDISDRIIFHSQPHHMFAREKIITEDEAWRRWELDIQDISSHGFNGFVFKSPALKSPKYFTDTETLGKIAQIASDNRMDKLFLDIVDVSLACEEVEGKYYLEEFPSELDKIVNTVSGVDLTPVLYFDETRMTAEQFDNLQKAIELMKEKPLGSTLQIKKSEGFISNIDFPLFESKNLDWTRETSGLSPGNWIYTPAPHWGHHHDMRILTGLYSLGTRSPVTGLSVYNEPHGNPENDFDIKIGIDQHTPGDLMMTYPSEGYIFYPTLRWECFRAGLVDRALIDLLLDKIKKNPSKKSSKSALEFLDGIIKTASHKSVVNTYDADDVELIRQRVIDYLLWCDGGEKVVHPSIFRDVIFTIGSRQFVANGEKMEMTVEPIIIDGSTFIPARYLVEPLGGVALWEGSTRTVILEALGHRVELGIDKVTATSDGKTITLSKPPTIVNGRTLIPLRSASTLLGADVSWNGNTREATCGFDLEERPLLRKK